MITSTGYTFSRKKQIFADKFKCGYHSWSSCRKLLYNKMTLLHSKLGKWSGDIQALWERSQIETIIQDARQWEWLKLGRLTFGIPVENSF